MQRYELIDHTADIAMRVYGGTLPELFENAGFALFDMITDTNAIAARERRLFTLRRDSVEELLIEWLNTLLFVFETEQMLFSEFSVKTLDTALLAAEAGGDTYREGLHTIKKPVKAATYHNLSIREHSGVWEATVVLDV